MCDLAIYLLRSFTLASAVASGHGSAQCLASKIVDKKEKYKGKVVPSVAGQRDTDKWKVREIFHVIRVDWYPSYIANEW